MMTKTMLLVEATTADGVWTLAVRSSNGVVGHIFRVDGEYAYFAGRFNAFTTTFSDPSLERLKERIIASRGDARGRLAVRARDPRGWRS